MSTSNLQAVLAKSKGGRTNPVVHVWKLVEGCSQHIQTRCCIHTGIMDHNKIEIKTRTLMWLCVKCPCHPLYHLLHWLTLRLSPFCTWSFWIYYIHSKLFSSGCPKLLRLKALKSLEPIEEDVSILENEFLTTAPLQNRHLFPYMPAW